MPSPLQLGQELLQEEQFATCVGQALVLLFIREVEALQARIRKVRVLARLPELVTLAWPPMTSTADMVPVRSHLHEHVSGASDPHFGDTRSGHCV